MEAINQQIESAVSAFRALLSEQLQRTEKMEREEQAVRLCDKKSLVIGICAGTGLVRF